MFPCKKKGRGISWTQNITSRRDCLRLNIKCPLNGQENIRSTQNTTGCPINFVRSAVMPRKNFTRPNANGMLKILLMKKKLRTIKVVNRVWRLKRLFKVKTEMLIF